LFNSILNSFIRSNWCYQVITSYNFN